MTYPKPLLRPLDASVAVASCTPAPRDESQCNGLFIDLSDTNGDGIPDVSLGGGIFVGTVNNTPTCLIPPQGNLRENVRGSQAWLDCVLAGGC